MQPKQPARNHLGVFEDMGDCPKHKPKRVPSSFSKLFHHGLVRFCMHFLCQTFEIIMG